MMHRRKFLMALLAVPASAAAQYRHFRIGWLVFGGATLGPIEQSLKDALAQRGLVDGGNIEIQGRHTDRRRHEREPDTSGNRRVSRPAGQEFHRCNVPDG